MFSSISSVNDDLLFVSDPWNDEESETGVKFEINTRLFCINSAATTPLGRTTKKRKRSSWIYNPFAIEEGAVRRRCTVRRCKVSYSASTATGTLASHIRNKHGILNDKDVDAQKVPFRMYRLQWYIRRMVNSVDV